MQGEGSRLSGHSLYRQLKKLFLCIATEASTSGRDEDARVFEAASTHWLRHTFGSHSVAAGIPLDVIREDLGHASIGTTSRYLRADIGRRIRESRRLVGSGRNGIG
jgi:integrase